MSTAVRQKRHNERARRAGMVRVCVWVPAEAKEHILALAERLRKVKKR